MAITLTLSLTLVLALQTPGVQPARISSTAVEPCRGCGLVIDSVATLGSGKDSNEYFVRPSFSGAVVNGRVLLSATVPILSFDSTGRFTGQLGREGQGPGEFRSWITGMGIGPRRSVHVFVVQRVAVFDSSLRFARDVTLARGSLRPTVLSDGKYAGIGRIPPLPGGRVPSPADYPKVFDEPLVHLFGVDGALIRSFGSKLTFADEIIASGSNGTVWTAKRAPYELRQWAQDGTLLRVIERTTPLFDRSPYLGPWPYVRGRGPRPRLVAVRQDSDGRVWTAFSIARKGMSFATINEKTIEECCDHLVEVLDPSTGALLGAGRIPFPVSRLLEDGYIVAGTTSPSGEPLVVLYRARLTVPRQ